MTLRSHLLSSATPLDRLTYRAVTARPAGDMSADHYIAFRPGSAFVGWLNQFEPAVWEEPTCTAPLCT